MIGNIFVIFGGRVYQHIRHAYGYQLVFLFLYSYEAYFIQALLKKSENQLAWTFNCTFQYIDDVFSLNNSKFDDFVDRIYSTEHEIKDITDTARTASYIDMHTEIGSNGRLRTKFYDKGDDFHFPMMNFPFICSNIPAAPAHGVYVSLSWSDIPELVVPVRISLIEGCCLQGIYWTKGSYWLSWSHQFERFRIATMVLVHHQYLVGFVLLDL